MKRILRLLAVLGAFGVMSGVPQVHAVTNQSLAVPVFTKPTANGFWDEVRNAGSGSVPFVVANPDNGPGGAPDTAYSQAMSKNNDAGIKTLGYIQTNYQARSFKDAYADIDRWYRQYPQTKGIFIGLLKQGGPSEACYIAGLYSHVKNIRPNDLVVLGAGTHLSSAYEPYGDIFLNAESDYASYQSGWNAQYKGFEDNAEYQNRFWHIVYGVSAEQYNGAFDSIRSNNAGWLYITDKGAPSPYTMTPSYWQNEATDISALPASDIPNRGKTTLPRGCISLSTSADSTVDTTKAKQSVTKSSVTVSNISDDYPSEPLTTVQLLNLPKGASFASLTGNGWSCTLGTKTCSYKSTLPASSSAPKLATTLTAGCDYAGGDAVLRATNYAGNRWDIKIPMRAPVGCESSTPAGQVNSSSSGQIVSLTTQGIETTPAITPLGGEPEQNASTGDTKVVGGLSPLKIILITILGVLLLIVGVWAGWLWHQRRRYHTRI